MLGSHLAIQYFSILVRRALLTKKGSDNDISSIHYFHKIPCCARALFGVPKRQNGKLRLFVMGKKHIIVVFLFVRLIAPKRRRHIVLILVGFGTQTKRAHSIMGFSENSYYHGLCE